MTRQSFFPVQVTASLPRMVSDDGGCFCCWLAAGLGSCRKNNASGRKRQPDDARVFKIAAARAMQPVIVADHFQGSQDRVGPPSTVKSQASPSRLPSNQMLNNPPLIPAPIPPRCLFVASTLTLHALPFSRRSACGCIYAFE